MSEVETIRELCQEIAEEKDPEKTRLLLIELREMTALLSDDTRLRTGFLVRLLRRIEKLDRESSSGKADNVNKAA